MVHVQPTRRHHRSHAALTSPGGVACSCARSSDVGATRSRRSVTLGDKLHGTKYHRFVSDVQEYLVSSSGQMSLPASVRHRWNLDRGGPVDVIDLGFGVLTVPKGQGRRLLNDLLSREDHATFVRSLDDDADLATT